MSSDLSSYSGTYLKTFSPGMFLTLRSNVALVKLHFYLCSLLILSLIPSSHAARTNRNNSSWTVSISAGSPSPDRSGPAKPFHRPGPTIPRNSETSTQLHPKLKGAKQQLYDVKLVGPFAPFFAQENSSCFPESKFCNIFIAFPLPPGFSFKCEKDCLLKLEKEISLWTLTAGRLSWICFYYVGKAILRLNLKNVEFYVN